MKAIFLLAALTSHSFDLNCTGVVSTLGLEKPPASYSSHLRIDLTRSKWCEGDCLALHDIVRIDPTELVLEDSFSPTTGTVRHTVDRVTGEEHTSAQAPRLAMTWRGVCETSAFSGFPEVKTRF